MTILYTFTKFKSAKLKSELLKLTCLNKTVIFTAFVLGALLYYTCVSNVVYTILLYYHPNESEFDK